jgi:hypothetical protein
MVRRVHISPSLTDSVAAMGPALFACFLGRMRPSGSPTADALGGWSVTFPNRLSSPSGEETTWISRFPCREFSTHAQVLRLRRVAARVSKRPATCGLRLIKTRSAPACWERAGKRSQFRASGESRSVVGLFLSSASHELLSCFEYPLGRQRPRADAGMGKQSAGEHQCRQC